MGDLIKFEFDVFEEFDFERSRIPASKRADAIEEVKSEILTSVLQDMDNQTSSVTGQRFPRLSEEYKKAKIAAGHPGIPNLEFDGDLKNSILVAGSGSNLKIHVRSSQEAKADGHCNFSGKSSLPLRRFIPNRDEGETFRPGIRDKILDILEGYAED